MHLPKIMYRICFRHEHPYMEILNSSYWGDYNKSIELAIQSVFSSMNIFDKNEARINFPQEVDIEFKKVVVIDNEEYSTEAKECNITDKNYLMKRFKDFVEGNV